MGNKSPAMGAHCFIVPGQPSHFIEVRPTPWNDVVLAKKTCEIIDCCPEISDFNTLLQQAIEFIKQSGFEYVQARVEHIREKRRLLENTGFYYAELSYELSFHNPKRYVFERDLSRRLLLFPVTSQQDIALIKTMAVDNFKYGRMLEDLYIDYTAAKQRTANWIDALARSPHELYLAKHGDKAVGFHAQRPSMNGCGLDWILTGACSEYSMLSVPLWHAAFRLAQDRDIQKITTMISAANVGVLNLYNSFPFHIDRALCGYHLMITD
ncbi:hypothetical protein [Aeromonas salmonicida]|uniref:hypothetical protein n=1 Tax=Aeromonas salmonicida TaxID=645 RepID=UPI0013A6A715|nr:hypothetical protein [Aeromonas salmonicida]